MTIYTLKSFIDFGYKHKGETVEEIIRDDPDWLAWAVDTIDWFELDEEAGEALEFALWDDEDEWTYSFH